MTKTEMFTQFAKPVELVSALSALNGMKRRSGGLLGAGDLAGGTVNIDTELCVWNFQQQKDQN